ncbi:TonB-dependent receptor [Verticiella sediminum]|uniref:TonB-dependent receptor n=1 Tax=Verticiella sediminum TaxID=1247510 RepID=A0A556B111_9BURK|nr:TonB-dependent receptor [Verticiella sediminum]TSH98852.1 TonB-dependent receptor [Verticiella sediminum]
MTTPSHFGLTAIAASLALAAPLATAQTAATAPAQLETITVIGARSPQPLADTLGDITVIDRETIERAGQSTLAELLSRTHSIEYIDTGGPQNVASLFVRGANANQTLILVDGLRFNSATAGTSAFNSIPLEHIERIEVLRGASSSLYGADAVGGVINIITRGAADQPFVPHFSVGFGSRGTSRVSAGVAGSSHGWRYAVNANYGQSKGYNITTPDNAYAYNPDRDSYYQRNVSASLGYAWRTGHEVSAEVFHTRVNGGYDNGEPYFNDRVLQRVEGFAISSRDRLADNWYSTLRLGSTRDDNRNVTAPSFGTDEDSSLTRFRTRQNQYLWQNEFQLASTQRLTVALERLEQRVTGDLQDWSAGFPVDVDYPTTKRNTNSATAVYTGDFDRHHLQASLRHDDDSQYDGQTTGGAAYGFDLTPNLRATVAANTAFHAPTFNDLYYPGGGNPDLEPEKSRNVEAGLRWHNASSELGATVYRNRVTNLILGWPPINVGKAVLRGVTLTGAHRWQDTTLRASVDFADPHNAETGEQLPYRAKRTLRLAADQRFGPALLGAEWYLTSERYSSARERLGGYGRLDLTAGYDINRDTQVQLRVNNVFDKDYTLNPGYATQGTSVFVNLAWRPR